MTMKTSDISFSPEEWLEVLARLDETKPPETFTDPNEI
jgi:hypothetical protein